MLSKNINFKNFKLRYSDIKVKKKLKSILSEQNEVLNSLKKNYKNSYKKKLINKYKKFENFRLIGMGGSVLGTKTIYEFLKYRIKKKFIFIDNLQSYKKKTNKKKFVNIIVSKSGNTLETISNMSLYINKNDNNIFLTENKNNLLNLLAQKLKSEIVHHNNFIGGRYSVLSEVGMLPAELMGLDPKKFKQFNSLIKDKKFIKSLIDNVSSTLKLIKNKKHNSVIINYDEKSENLFKWYQQLIAESLGKNSIGILPIISNMPKDNHSVMQLYLDGNKNNFFTFFYLHDDSSVKINNRILNKYDNFLENKKLSEITYAQFRATQNVFEKKKIPFRSFEINKRNEKTLGELFSFFILETILLGKALNINPYDQPAVELIKKETNKILF